jgi:hypothetical protein
VDLIGSNVLAHFAQHADDVHARASAEANKQQFHRTRTGVGAAHLRSRVHAHLVASVGDCAKCHVAEKVDCD